ncbi:MAG TPA: response regulator [Candidatus Saccharimonadia bacterium]|nr:response regulator [Candidatus Saccharimonadia bacterium]
MSGDVKEILIVEDEKSLATALELKLKREGYKVTVAYNGKEGLDQLSRKAYDVVLLDLIMPIMNGFEVLSAARKLANQPIFIVLSNLTQPSDADRCLKLGARKFLVKSETSLAALAQEIAAL